MRYVAYRDEWLTVAGVKRKTGMTRSSIYKQMGLGLFPKATSFGARRVRWRCDDIEFWMKKKIMERGHSRLG